MPIQRYAPKGIAGYLPYYPPRFVSQAEEAAARLPAQVKVQSLKNLLLRQGAKPVELEYAGLDDFIAGQPGPTVASADVLAHLRREGPLGQLKRVEQQHEGPVEGIWGDGLPGELPEGGTVPGAPPRPPAYAPSIRQPFSPSTASNQTQYQNYTVPGKQGDFTGYREVLLEDPKNRPGGESMVRPIKEQSADDANFLEYANRRLPELDGAAPDQQPLQQEYQELLNQAQMRGMMLVYRTDGTPFLEPNQTGGAIDAHSADYWARYNEYPDRIAVQNIQSDVGQAASKKTGQAGRAADDPNDDFSDAPITPDSPLARDDNWKSLMARHIALQSIAGGGKPITIPTGRQMVDVEGFGLSTHGGNHDAAAAAAAAYNEDLVRRLQKIFRGLDPKGAAVAAGRYADPPPSKTILPTPLADDPTLWSRNFVHSDLLPPIRERAMSAMELADSDPDLYIWADLPEPEGSRYGFFDPSVHEELAHIAAGSPNMEARQAASDALNLWRRAAEISLDEKRAGTSRAISPSDAPGWTVTPSPEAVRAALRNGLPIMSLAPLLLAPSQENR